MANLACCSFLFGRRIFSSTLLSIRQKALPIQAASIASKANRDRTLEAFKPPPFPYKEKHLSLIRNFMQNPLRWWDENSVLIVIEGNIGSGKTDLAKKLAAELEMLHVPEATLDLFYINQYGYDMRQLDSKLPETVRSFDIKNFYGNPRDRRSAQMQLLMLRTRYEQYIDALAHIFNTGQGVILERCVYSDFVFLDAMAKFGYVKPGVQKFYHLVRQSILPFLMRPHLIIYLDAQPNVLMERIKKRNIDYEVKSEVITESYLKSIGDSYREHLKLLSRHSELLFYDWTSFGDLEVLVEDIERLDLLKYDKYDEKLSDWRMYDYWDFVDARYTYTSRKMFLMQQMNIPIYTEPDLLLDPNYATEFWEIWNDAPGKKFTRGYNADMGDSNILIKNSEFPRRLD